MSFEKIKIRAQTSASYSTESEEDAGREGVKDKKALSEMSCPVPISLPRDGRLAVLLVEELGDEHCTDEGAKVGKERNEYDPPAQTAECRQVLSDRQSSEGQHGGNHSQQVH